MIGIIITLIFFALIILSFMIVSNKDLSHSVILFMGFGLGCTILYFIFSAPDVALTEAVIGAGLSSVVFLVAILQTTKKEKEIQ
ncbi:MAG: hydrogenase subunit MbhD domain-containing protein [Campylobacterota bacterium]|nr:hydrogenase subunit MbhD domain-containing protein [Campylobacterota bacterium]